MPTLLVNSVIVPMKNETKTKMITGGKCLSGTKAFPILLAKQEAMLPLDIANPPPNRNIKLQGIFVSITSQVIKPSEAFCGLFSAATNERTNERRNKEFDRYTLTISAVTVNETWVFWNKKHQNRDEYDRR